MVSVSVGKLAACEPSHPNSTRETLCFMSFAYSVLCWIFPVFLFKSILCPSPSCWLLWTVSFGFPWPLAFHWGQPMGRAAEDWRAKGERNRGIYSPDSFPSRLWLGNDYIPLSKSTTSSWWWPPPIATVLVRFCYPLFPFPYPFRPAGGHAIPLWLALVVLSLPSLVSFTLPNFCE